MYMVIHKVHSPLGLRVIVETFETLDKAKENAACKILTGHIDVKIDQEIPIKIYIEI